LHCSFGDPRRLDYGTGHETAFLAILFAFGARGLLAKADAADAVLCVFAAYIRLMRRLQSVYVLEPAGSHGVWGLDDYHVLPFLFGAAQLVGMEDDVPTGKVYTERIIKDYADSYLYVDAIRQVLLAKTGAPFHETSPMLYDITAVPTWSKTHAGLMKMYRAEVLGKFPVIQHFLFGPTLRWPGDEEGQGAAMSAKASKTIVSSTTMPPPPRPAKSPWTAGYDSTRADVPMPDVMTKAPWAMNSAAAQSAMQPPLGPTKAPWARSGSGGGCTR